MQSTVRIVPYQQSLHLDGAVSALLSVRAQDATYPPQMDAENTTDSFAAWLMNSPAIMRWVAIVDGVVAGHIMVTPSHAYLTDHLAAYGYESDAGQGVAEVAKFFVDPRLQAHGIGDALFTEALEFLRAADMQPGLAVVATSTKAVRFYGRHGMKDVGVFAGLHGANRVFVHEGDTQTRRHMKAA